jgi:hypothetical protein
MIAADFGMFAWYGRQIRCGIADGLHSGFSSTETVITWEAGSPAARFAFCSATS